jgi:hypothetical protein
MKPSLIPQGLILIQGRWSRANDRKGMWRFTGPVETYRPWLRSSLNLSGHIHTANQDWGTYQMQHLITRPSCRPGILTPS